MAIEVDRYISWPGPALAYKPGKMKIIELSERAHQQFGERFGLGAFHDAILAGGLLPMDILEANMNRWFAGS